MKVFQRYFVLSNRKIDVDITGGRGSSFSPEIPLGFRFIVRSRLFAHRKSSELIPVEACKSEDGEVAIDKSLGITDQSGKIG